ncbi:MAG: hypothetical protein WBO93_03840 [Gammaproteobacteria bacterium]
MRTICTFMGVLTGCLLAFAGSKGAAQPVVLSDEDLEVSYIYAAVLGTGTYQIKGRRLTMFRLPFSWAQRQATKETPGWQWLFPIVLGYDDLSNVDSDWIDALLPDQLVTLTALPGIEYIYPVSANWHVKPFIQLGAGRDFTSDETIAMTQFGIRSLGLFQFTNDWELRWGIALRWAGEYQFNSNDRNNLGIFDTGLDIRRNTPFSLLEKRVDMGAYYIFQRYVPEWRLSDAPDNKQEAVRVHEIGASVGLKHPHKLLGIPFQRVRVGYKDGDNIRGWTFGTEFPF